MLKFKADINVMPLFIVIIIDDFLDKHFQCIKFLRVLLRVINSRLIFIKEMVNS